MSTLLLNSPIKGKLILQGEIKDPGFASTNMGLGVGILPEEGKVYSPVDGEVSVLFGTNHAIGLVSDLGAEILIHVGMDTVSLGGEGFTPKVKQGDKVKKGDLLLEFDIEFIKSKNLDTITPFIVTNPDTFGQILIKGSENEVVVKKEDLKTTITKIEDKINEYGEISKEEFVAREIIKNVGGAENIKSAEHCATRLRLILKDKAKLNEKNIEAIDGVKGQFFAAAQYQIILGTGFVNKVYAEVSKLCGNIQGIDKDEVYAQMSLTQKISRTLGDIFVPIIPVLVATGLFMGLRGTLTSLGVHFGDNFILMSQILTDTAFAFLPALVTWSVMKKFGGTPVIGIVLGLMLVAPQLPNAYAIANGDASPLIFNLFGISIPVVGYQGSVLPAIILGIFAAKLESKLKNIIPDVVDLIVRPFLVLLISMLVGLLVVGPILHSIEIFLFNLVKSFLELPFGLGGFVIGGLHQLIVVSGIHHVFSALEIELLATTGKNMFNAIITGAIVAQGAAGLAVALKQREAKTRAMYISSVVPAFLGITEPVIFGINLRFVKPFICGLIGGACAGGVAAFMHLAGSGMGITVLPGTLLYMDNLLGYLIVNIVGFAVAFTLTMITYKPSNN